MITKNVSDFTVVSGTFFPTGKMWSYAGKNFVTYQKEWPRYPVTSEEA